jgi:PII-like signaling protein
MKTNLQLKRVMIFIDETDKHQGKNMSTAIVEKAKQLGCGGATVLRGILGFGAHKRVHSASIVDLSINLPEVIVIIDAAEVIDLLLPELDNMVKEGLVVVDDVEGFKYSVY